MLSLLPGRLPDLPPPNGQIPCEPHRQAWQHGPVTTGRYDCPQHYVPDLASQAPLVAPPQPDGPYQASVLIFVPEYAPEYISSAATSGHHCPRGYCSHAGSP